MRSFALVAAALLALVAPTASLAWGYAGHAMVCAIAESRLTEEGAALVAEALDLHSSVDDRMATLVLDLQSRITPPPERFWSDRDDRPMTFRQACLWPDESRRDTFKSTYEMHFVNVPEGQPFDLARDCARLDCALVGIQRFAQYLAQDPDGSRQREQKTVGLRFLGHFVGDVHQPLHVGDIDDLGGNRIDVTWFGKSVNLHKVWDSEILETSGFTTMAEGVAAIEALAATEDGAEAIASWETTEIVAWAAESHELANSLAYVQPDGTKVEDGTDLASSENPAYFEANREIVREQVLKAGVRLGYLINLAAAGKLPARLISLQSVTDP